MPLNTRTTVTSNRGSGQSVSRTDSRLSEATPGKQVSVSVEQSPEITTTETRRAVTSTKTETGGDKIDKQFSHYAYTIKFIIPVK